MLDDHEPTSRRAVSQLWLVGALSLVFWTPRAVNAAAVTVDCDGPGGDFSSLTAALDHLRASPQEPHHVAVSGTCRETVTVSGSTELTLSGEAGAMLVDPEGDEPHPISVLTIIDSQNVRVRGLVLRGAGAGAGRNPAHVVDSKASFSDCIFEGGGKLAGGGLWIQGLSNVHIEGARVRDNAPNGIRIDDGRLQIGSTGPTDRRSIIERNPTGIKVREGASIGVFGATLVRGNGFGIQADGSTVIFCCDDFGREVLDNHVGLDLMNGSTLELHGSALFRGNTIAGLNLRASSASVHGRVTVRANGNGSGLHSGGIVLSASQLDFSRFEQVRIVANDGAGVAILDNSSARLRNARIQGNSGAGIHVHNLSTITHLTDEVMVRGNGEGDLRCTQIATASGDLSGIREVDCTNVSTSEP